MEDYWLLWSPRYSSKVWQMARSSIEDFSDAATIDFSAPRPTLASCWSPPPPGVFKINVDGASSDLDGTSSIGVIIRDFNGETFAALCKPLQSHFPAELVEVLTLEHLNRASNYATHELALFARRNGSHHLWKGVTPSFLESIVQADLLL
ncbi:uncharacterized protein LOC115966551 [Quercus lobata]|uniref:uncharacterized protein LOC115966551 n=1 Tax=Quercus lobata TaxID=97700 RepID=UPI001244A520|nr:uncharacterized protein LOC115966551 [Quercus lobata]